VYIAEAQHVRKRCYSRGERESESATRAGHAMARFPRNALHMVISQILDHATPRHLCRQPLILTALTYITEHNALEVWLHASYGLVWSPQPRHVFARSPPPLPTSAVFSSAAGDIIVNTVFGITATVMSAVAIYQGSRTCRFWRAHRHQQGQAPGR